MSLRTPDLKQADQKTVIISRIPKCFLLPARKYQIRIISWLRHAIFFEEIVVIEAKCAAHDLFDGDIYHLRAKCARFGNFLWPAHVEYDGVLKPLVVEIRLQETGYVYCFCLVFSRISGPSR